ncbi:Ref family recombination enhancement nuclease [uncultured Roseobacter sp.]|uniref:Ref family recombination enhancement nuclease n=1 Tax=uncultured Roseobacter sp. TaxID=114847 RepID=UPI0026069539|nr:Ref family recombination enhancement nuclease [uncultured Roseobacter sp.]
MTRIVTEQEIYQKSERVEKDPAYLAMVRQLPCCICDNFGMIQSSPTEAHHVKSGRFSFAKTPDRQAIPLCHSHHNKLRPYPGDEDKIGFHNSQEAWKAAYGPDHDYTSATQDAVEALV